MPRLIPWQWMLVSLLTAIGAAYAPSHASSFPSKEITLIAPFVPGGPADIVARRLAGEILVIHNQKVVVVNRPGASATIGTAEAFRAKPDGYTVLLADNISTVFQPHVLNLPYKGADDFYPVIKVLDITNALVVKADAKWRTLYEFMAYARARPGQMRVSTAGKYTGTDLNILELNHVAGVNTVTIPTNGTGASINLLLGGHVEAIAGGTGAVGGHVRGGKLRILAMFKSQRDPSFPDVPSTVELGYKTTIYPMFFISAPKGLDRNIAERLSSLFAGALNSSRFREFAAKSGFFVDPKGTVPLRQELREWQDFFNRFSKTLGITRP